MATDLKAAAQQAFNLLDRLPINEGYNDETVEVLDALRAGLAAQSPAEGDERAAFEAVYLAECRRRGIGEALADHEFFRRDGDGTYSGHVQQHQWTGFQAGAKWARDAQTTPKAHGDEREAFETWAEACDLPLDESLSGIPGSGPLYVNAETVMAWEGWNARAALNVQPKGTVADWRRVVGRMARALDQCADNADPASHPATMREVATRLTGLLTGVEFPDLAAAAQAPAPAPEVASAPRAFDAVKSFADSVLAMLDERIKAAEQNAHPFKDYFGDHPETIVAAKAQASELREVRTQVRILGDRALVDLMKFRPATSAPAVGDELSDEQAATFFDAFQNDRRLLGDLEAFKGTARDIFEAASKAQPLAVPAQSPAEGDAVALADGFDGWWAAHSIHRVLSPGGFARMVWEASARHNRKTVLGATDSTSGFYPEDEGSTPSGQATEVDRQLGSDHEIALMEGHRIPAMDAYFKARPSLDGPDERKAFEAGYQRGWRDSNSAHPIHPQPKGTDEPVAWMDDGTKVHNGPGHPVFRVITADTKQNMPASIQAEYTTPLYAHQATYPAPAHATGRWTVISPDGKVFTGESAHRAANEANKHLRATDPAEAKKWADMLDRLRAENEAENERLLAEHGTLNCPACGGSGHIGDVDAPGMVLVPVEPTTQMLDAACKACDGRVYPQDMRHGPRAMMADRWAAMLAAAPKAQPPVQHTNQPKEQA